VDGGGERGRLAVDGGDWPKLRACDASGGRGRLATGDGEWRAAALQAGRAAWAPLGRGIETL